MNGISDKAHTTAWGDGYQAGLRGKPNNPVGSEDQIAVWTGGYLAGQRTRNRTWRQAQAAFERSMESMPGRRKAAPGTEVVIYTGKRPKGRRKKTILQRLGLRP